MPEAIGPGSELLCIRTCKCANCQEGVDAGQRYVCEDIIQPTFLQEILFGPCSCGEAGHPFICVMNKSHAFCPTVFVPLGDPDAVKETNEPKVAPPKKLITIEEFAKRYINV